MEYKHTAERENYAVYAAGAVFYAAPGHTAFPLRLANEVFRRCQALRAASGAAGPCVLYDPCCGGAYHLATLSFFNWQEIDRIYASDLDEDALSIARRNLSLLSPDGMDRRIAELTSMYAQFGKESHATALQHALALKQRLLDLRHEHEIETRLARADATDRQALAAALTGTKIDIVLTDIPYGQWSSWHPQSAALAQAADPLHQMLDALLPLLAQGAVVAIAAAKQEKIKHAGYLRMEKLSVGKRRIVILQPHFAT